MGMKFFNIDLHISVIADLRKIFTDLGHTVTDKCLSGHHDVVGRKKDYYKELSGDKWTMMVHKWQFKEFANNHAEELAKYDGFIVTYPPVFLMLYEQIGKPIILQMPIRYDYGMHGRADYQRLFFDAIKSGCNTIVSANSLYEKRYFEGFSEIPCYHIPSLCEYTGTKYSGGTGPALVYSPDKRNAAAVGGYWRGDLRRGYKWSDLGKFRAVVHFPYQISTMSIFEQYMSNIPMLFPTKRFLEEMYFGGWPGILSQVSNMKLYGSAPKSVMPFNGGIDPNDYKSKETVRYWLDGADFYNGEWMPHILYFDSVGQAKEMLSDITLLQATSEKMKAANAGRKSRVYKMWEDAINGIKV